MYVCMYVCVGGCGGGGAQRGAIAGPDFILQEEIAVFPVRKGAQFSRGWGWGIYVF